MTPFSRGLTDAYGWRETQKGNGKGGPRHWHRHNAIFIQSLGLGVCLLRRPLHRSSTSRTEMLSMGDAATFMKMHCPWNYHLLHGTGFFSRRLSNGWDGSARTMANLKVSVQVPTLPIAIWEKERSFCRQGKHNTIYARRWPSSCNTSHTLLCLLAPKLLPLTSFLQKLKVSTFFHWFTQAPFSSTSLHDYMSWSEKWGVFE